MPRTVIGLPLRSELVAGFGRKQSSRTQSQGSPRLPDARERGSVVRSRLQVLPAIASGRTRKPGVAECWRYPDERFLGERLSGRGHSSDAIGPVGS